MKGEQPRKFPVANKPLLRDRGKCVCPGFMAVFFPEFNHFCHTDVWTGSGLAHRNGSPINHACRNWFRHRCGHLLRKHAVSRSKSVIDIWGPTFSYRPENVTLLTGCQTSMSSRTLAEKQKGPILQLSFQASQFVSPTSSSFDGFSRQNMPFTGLLQVSPSFAHDSLDFEANVTCYPSLSMVF